MPTPSRLTLIIPNVGTSALSAQESAASEKFPLLTRIGTRGTRARRWQAGVADEARLPAWQRAVLAALNIDERSNPSAALESVGRQLHSNSSDWWHATPIHLAAGLNEVALVELDQELALTADEIDSLTEVIQAHLDDANLILHRMSAGWLVESATRWHFDAVTVRFAATHDWNAGLPKGADSGRLRRLMTEIQMVLHDHPVNRQRAARGLPSANALWVWGNGQLATTSQSLSSAFVAGAHPFVLGLRAIHGFDGADQARVEDLVKRASAYDKVIAVIDVEQLEELETRWLAPLMNELKRGAFGALEIALDEWEIAVDRAQLRRFWRRDQPVHEWLAR